MKHFIILITAFCFSINLTYSKSTPSKNMQHHESFEKIHNKFLAWKKTISADQSDLFYELFNQYHEIYTQYLKDQKNKELEMLLQEFDKNIAYLMNNWQSFYKEHSNIVVFHNKVQKWKDQLLSKKVKEVQSLLNNYEQKFQQYDQDPLNALNKSKLDKLTEKIKQHMTI